MPRKSNAAAKPAMAPIARKGALKRARRLAGFLSNNTGKNVSADSIVDFLSGTDEDPSTIIEIR